MADVIKRAGKRPTEDFEKAKLHASILAACLSVRSPEGEAEKIAEAVCHHVATWLEQNLKLRVATYGERQAKCSIFLTRKPHIYTNTTN